MTGTSEPVCLHPLDMKMCGRGVAPFLWPVTFEEHETVVYAFAGQLVTYLRECDVDIEREAELVWLNFGQLVLECLELFTAVALNRRASEADMGVSFGSQSRVYEAVAAQRPPAPSFHTARLLRGVPHAPAWQSPLRMLKHGLSDGSLRYKPRTAFRPESDILTFVSSPEITAHADALQRRVTIGIHGEWFHPGVLTGLTYRSSLSGGTITTVIDAMRYALLKVGERLPDFVIPYLEDLLHTICSITELRLRDLEDVSAQLPREFWSGSIGHHCNRVMARVVQKSGGVAVGHDHGASNGFYRSYDWTILECNYLTQFVTYSPAMAEGLKNNLRPEYLVLPAQPCEIVVLPGAVSESKTSSSLPGDVPPRRLMFVSTLYVGERCFLTPQFSDIVAIDWQARLFAELRQLGFDLLYKPHPASPCPPPPSFGQLFDVSTVDAPFEDVTESADILIFDQPQSTSFRHALLTDRPIVLFDFGRIEFTEKAQSLLRRRCQIVKGWCEPDGRAQIDWDGLAGVIAEAPALNDRAYVREFYGTA